MGNLLFTQTFAPTELFISEKQPENLLDRLHSSFLKQTFRHKI